MDILLVEDDEGNRTVIIEFLTDEGYVVCGAEHGVDALALLNTTMATPRLILLDLMMPLMNGWSFRTRQRANPDWANIPIVVLTASPALLDEYESMDIAALLAKPIDLDELLRLVQQFCPRADALDSAPTQASADRTIGERAIAATTS